MLAFFTIAAAALLIIGLSLLADWAIVRREKKRLKGGAKRRP